MKLLLDTHALLWFVEDDPRLGAAAREAISDPANELYVSSALFWEVAIKVGLGKYAIAGPLDAYFADAIQLYGLRVLQLTLQHAQAVAILPHHHRDPFDRLMIAQAMVEGLSPVSGDTKWGDYGVSVVW